jgi:protein-tyrosine phosphatase
MLQLRRKMYTWVERSVVTSGALGTGGSAFEPSPGRIIFVCTGNICRSPYAEFVARRHGLQAISCGTHTRGGLPADRTATEEARQRGVDMQSHLTTRWEDVELRAGDLIIAMQLRHALVVRPRARRHGSRVVMLNSLLLPEFAVIWDPYGRPQQAFSEAFDLIDCGVERLAARLRTAQPSLAKSV